MLPDVHKRSARGLFSTLWGPKTTSQREAAQTAASLLGEANLKEEIVPRPLSKCGFAHKHTHTLWIQTAAVLIGTLSTKKIFQNHNWRPGWGRGKNKQRKTKGKSWAALRLWSANVGSTETRRHAQSLRVREGSGPAHGWTSKFLMASRVHDGHVYSHYYCRHQALPVPTSSIKLLCLT